MENSFINMVSELLARVTLSCLDKEFVIVVRYDKTYQKYLSSYPINAPQGRVYIQVRYKAICSKTGNEEVWRGRKWYLSEYMLKDEIIKTAFIAFKSAVEHEVYEGFKVDGKVLFNPHVDFEELLKISDKEVKRS